MSHPPCLGQHPVDGPEGCGNEDCRGQAYCVPSCPGCPDAFLTACRGKHPVDGPHGCGNEDCRGHARCVRTCEGCPDVERGASEDDAAEAEPTDAEEKAETAADPEGFFGGRSGSDIRLYLACLAGPADPAERNDIRFLDELQKTYEIPHEHIWRLLERQCTERSILATLADCIETVEPGQMLFAYLGGHGDSADGHAEWSLGSYGATQGTDVAKLLARCRGEVFVVADSCHSGALLRDLQNALESDSEAWTPPRLTALSSAQAGLSARTGWRLLAMLHESALEERRTPRETARHVARALRTPEKRQRAQFSFFDGPSVTEATEQSV